jgi:hypothetical protein
VKGGDTCRKSGTTLPVILSFQGIDKQVNDELGVFSPLRVVQSDPNA